MHLRLLTLIRTPQKRMQNEAVKSSGGRFFVNADFLKGYFKEEENSW